MRVEVFDVEVLPNFFSVTFVDFLHYCEVFKDITDAKGREIPLVQKLSVAEIKARLKEVEHKSYYITADDDSQLLELVAHFTKMNARDERGYPARTDCFTFNGQAYDNLMIAMFLMNYRNISSTKHLITVLYNFSKKIISAQNDREAFKNDYQLTQARKFKLPYRSIDLMRVFALNKAGVIVDKDTGERVGVPKGLKQTSINLQWYELLEYQMPPISEKDVHYYLKGNKQDFDVEQINKLVDDWDRFIIDEYIPDMLHYNLNDVFITAEIARLNKEEIRSRYSVSAAFNVNLLSSSRSNMGDVLFEKFYSKFSGLPPELWKGQKTERTAMALKKIIFPFISFKTKELQDFLEHLKTITLYRVGKDDFNKEISFGNVVYTMATGGLHTKDRPMCIKSTSAHGLSDTSPMGRCPEDFVILHADVSSYYPSIMSAHKVAPAHLNRDAFCGLVQWLKDTRVKAKHSKEDKVDGIVKEVYALVLKIVINAIYGKLGFEKGDLYDRKAVLDVTINGQLMLLMLCEEFELNNIEVISANTDGIMIKAKNKDIDLVHDIIKDWQAKTKMDMDVDILHCLIARDVNNYIAQFRTSKGLKDEYKGDYNPYMYAADLSKGYNAPIVAKAVYEYFINGTPIMETLRNATNILDFCKTQNIGKQFHVEMTNVEDNKLTVKKVQRYVRYYVSNKGNLIEKVSNLNPDRRGRLISGYNATILNTLDDKDISLRDINFKYYYLECNKLIEPILLGISPKGRGKSAIKKYNGQHNSLFDDDSYEEH